MSVGYINQHCRGWNGLCHHFQTTTANDAAVVVKETCKFLNHSLYRTHVSADHTSYNKFAGFL